MALWLSILPNRDRRTELFAIGLQPRSELVRYDARSGFVPAIWEVYRRRG